MGNAIDRIMATAEYAAWLIVAMETRASLSETGRVFRDGVERAVALSAAANRDPMAQTTAAIETFLRYEFRAEIDDNEALIKVLH